jgi:CBS domain-containing protein
MALVLGMLGLFFNPLLVLIALFVWMGGRQESSLVQLRAAIAGLPIRSAMITDFRAIGRREPLSRAVELTLAGFQHDFPVVEDRRAVGVLTRADLVRGLSQAGNGAPVEDWMHRDFGTAEPGEMLEAALSRFGEHEPSTIVVARGDEVLGIITPENIGELVLFETAAHPDRPASPGPARGSASRSGERGGEGAQA